MDECTYPWGNTLPSVDLLNYNINIGDTTAVGSYESGKKLYGIHDLAGNVWEWVADWYGTNYYSTLEDGVHNPTGPISGDSRVMRGGSWYSNENLVGSANRGLLRPADWDRGIGFRCALGTSP